VDDDVASTFGYHPPAPAGDPAQGDLRSSGWNPSPAELLIATGQDENGEPVADRPMDNDGNPLPDGGCAGEADRALTGGKTIDTDLIARLLDEGWSSAEADSRTQSAMAHWSACMQSAGYEFTSPWAANNEYADMSLSPAEVVQARADVACRHSTNLVGIWNAVEKAYEDELIAQHRTEYDTVTSLASQRLSRAKAIDAAQG
ncbi:MAG TPA: hypothetical protein VFN19_11355, partial [Candidatus Nanopelagicales bacterium]|nr:hypothetical protein [Candidatus Nanopelagicales bacterium]